MSLWKSLVSLHQPNDQETDFKQFQDLLYSILQARGVYVKDIDLNHIAPEERRRMFALGHNLWTQLKEFESPQTHPKKTHAKVVNKYSLEGVFLARYASTKEAGLRNNLHPENISDVCRGVNQTSGGYMWSYAGEEEL